MVTLVVIQKANVSSSHRLRQVRFIRSSQSIYRDEMKDVVVFHAGTKESNGEIVTSGGRVLAVTAYAESLEEAVRAAYAGVDSVTFEGKTFRRDIAHRYFSPSKYSHCNS
jgi:phosphoribosylamine-glycine ligase